MPSTFPNFFFGFNIDDDVEGIDAVWRSVNGNAAHVLRNPNIFHTHPYVYDKRLQVVINNKY